jgi:pilus assembly protein CpaF
MAPVDLAFRKRTLALTGVSIQQLSELKHRVHQRLLDSLNLSLLDQVARPSLRSEIAGLVKETTRDENVILTAQQTDQLLEDLLDELLGLGPLEALLRDETISDILINGHNRVFVERHGLIELSDVKFYDERHLIRTVNKIISAVGRRIDESHPMVDARLADGSRLNAIIPPLAVDGALVSIRRFNKSLNTLDALISGGSLTSEMGRLLEAYVGSRLNIIVSGGTGSGKTTLLNALSASIPLHERVITIEDSAELQFERENVARLETRSASMDGEGEVTQRHLLKNALRMRPDRIMLGEVRGDECFDMLQAMNTGHEGSMTTIHANSAEEALTRVQNMIIMSGVAIPASALMDQIGQTLHVVLHTERSEDGCRRLVSISESARSADGSAKLTDVFRFERKASDVAGQVTGAFEGGIENSKFLKLFSTRGINPLGPDTSMDTAQAGLDTPC